MPDPSILKDELWNDSSVNLSEDQKRYSDVVLEQYKLYVETTNHISDRRMHANNFFLTLHTSVAAAIGFLLISESTHIALLIAMLAAVAGSAMAIVWMLLLRSYKNLNAAKFEVVEMLEVRLPASAFSRCEWSKLNYGKDRATYWPLSHLEFGVPVVVLVVYMSLFAMSANLLYHRSPGGPAATQPASHIET